MIKKGLKEDMPDFLQMPNKLTDKKRRQINKSKPKASLRETSSKKVIIGSFNNFDKKVWSVSIPAIIKSKLQAKDIDIVMIAADTYRVASC